MRKKVLITIVIALLTLLMVLLSIPLLEKKDVADFIRKSLQDDPSTAQEQIELACPEHLAVYYFVDLRQTPTLTDDDVYIAILNTQDKSYKAEIFVDGISQGKTTLTKNSKTTLESELITNWWRKGIQESPTQTDEEEDLIQEEQNQKTFYIDITIEGCNKSITPLTPIPPSVESVSATGSESASGEISSRYSIDISKSPVKYMPD